MYVKVIVGVVLCAFLQGSFGISRDEIISEYKPILAEKDANLTSDYHIVQLEYNFVYEQIKNDTINIMAVMNTQINTLKSTIATDKKNAQTLNETKTVNCLTVQETAAGKLTSDPINATCYNGVVYPDLSKAESDFQALANIPNATISSCAILHPLETQNSDFLECITRTILSLDMQIDDLKNRFEGAKNSTLKAGIQCIANQSSALAQQLNEINFQVTLCLTLS